ncbi:MAG: hypothetical protein K8I82_22120, partial [Anaerolineae bacterium]|nr:hypothetical protein [Anaerolineae bacterium]
PLKLRQAAILLVVILLSLYTIPPVRAAIGEILKVGGIEIRIGKENTSVPPNETLLNLAGKTTLAEAQEAMPFPLYIPQDKRLPDEVFLQNQAGQMVIMVWLNAGQIEMALYQFLSEFSVYKGADDAEITSVNGRLAVWIDTPHLLWFTENTITRNRPAFLIEAPVLLWENTVTDEQGRIYHVTYRLETGLSMEEAIQTAESLGTFSPKEGNKE